MIDPEASANVECQTQTLTHFMQKSIKLSISNSHSQGLKISIILNKSCLRKNMTKIQNDIALNLSRLLLIRNDIIIYENE